MDLMKTPKMTDFRPSDPCKKEFRLQRIAKTLFILETIAIIIGMAVLLSEPLSKYNIDFGFVIAILAGGIVAESMAYATYLLFYIIADMSITQKGRK